MRTRINPLPSRRRFFQRVAAATLLPTSLMAHIPESLERPPSLKTSLNAFSFNAPLSSGAMTIDDMIEFCAQTGFMGVDITGYYFKGYPIVPDDKYLYHVKRKAFKHGIDITGTGVRNDFTEPDPLKRKESVNLVKGWIEAAEKIGAPVLRIFASNQQPVKYSRDQILKWMMTDIQDCVTHGEKHGVVVAIQNHDDFIKTADHAVEIMNALKSEWFGLILDTGSYRVGDPYAQIAKTAPYAVNWQIKEKVFVDAKEVDVDMDKLIGIIKASGYSGYIPIETLGDGDPKVKIAALLDKVNTSLRKAQ